MSTTVIASAMGARLLFLPAVPTSLDVAAVRAVLLRHGVTWVPDPGVASAPEFIAAEGLAPRDAAALAMDLQAIGLTVRVVNKTRLTQSRRVGSAQATQVFFAVAGFALTTAMSLPVLDAWRDGAGLSAWSALAILPVLLIAVALANTMALALRGGTRLAVAGGPVDATSRTLHSELRELVEVLPAHQADLLMQRVARLQQRAQQDPDGPAAQELTQLAQDLRESSREPLRNEARSLREDIEHARRAVAEASQKV